MAELTAQQTFELIHSLFQKGRLTEAAQLCREILERFPDAPRVRNVLALIRAEQGDLIEAERHFRERLADAPRDVQTMGSLAHVLSRQGRLTDAVAIFSDVVARKPDLMSLARLSEALVRLGRDDEALDRMQHALLSGRSIPLMSVVAVAAHINLDNMAEAERIAGASVARAELAPEARQRIFFELARGRELAGDYDRAFEAYSLGNTVFSSKFDRAGHAARIDRIIRTFSAGTVAALPVKSSGSDLPVFVIGLPGDATTSIGRLFGAHSRAHDAGEVRCLPAVLDPLVAAETLTPDTLHERMSADFADTIAEEYVGDLQTYAPQAARIVDRNYGLFRYVGLLAGLFPQATYIRLTRDPMESCLACFTSRMETVSGGWTSDLADIAFVHNQHERLLEHWRVVAGDLNMVEVDYDALLRMPEQAKRIIESSNLPWEPACGNFLNADGDHNAHRASPTISDPLVRLPQRSDRALMFEKHLAPLRDALSSASAS